MATPPAVTCYVSLGSNLGDREGYLRNALQRLAALQGVSVCRVSSLYDTAPVGVTDQPRFLNLVAELRAKLPPLELLAATQRIEHDLRRVRGRRWGPRTIDIDILLCGEAALSGPELELPHPRMLEMQFVLVPLAEIAPELVLPDGRTAREAAAADDEVRRIAPPPL